METQLEKAGKKIGNYLIGKSLGQGTFGKVKVGVQIQTQEKVAVKILKKSKILDLGDIERVSREIHILKTVQHPHIVQLYEIIETNSKLYLIMEYASGGELFDYIVKHNKVSETKACKFFQQIISGVEYLAQLQIVHRDLKPENMLVDFDQGIKLVDFGLSNTYKNQELLKTACGSPCYAAPEMIAGKKYTGSSVDIWSCGVVLFAILSGYLPFEDPNTSKLYKKILSADYELPDFVSKQAADLIRRILTTDPDKRISIEEIKKHSWFQLVPNTLSQKPGVQVGVDPAPVDLQIIDEIEKKHKINKDYTMKCIQAYRHNNVTATYYLLLKKHLRNGGSSLADARQVTFDVQAFRLKQPLCQKTILPPKMKPTVTTTRSLAEGLNNFDNFTDRKRRQRQQFLQQTTMSPYSHKDVVLSDCQSPQYQILSDCTSPVSRDMQFSNKFLRIYKQNQTLVPQKQPVQSKRLFSPYSCSTNITTLMPQTYKRKRDYSQRRSKIIKQTNYNLDNTIPNLKLQQYHSQRSRRYSSLNAEVKVQPKSIYSPRRNLISSVF